MAIKYIIREVPPDQMDTSIYFDNDGLKEASGDYNNILFIVENRGFSGFNVKELDEVANEIEDLYNGYIDLTTGEEWAEYRTVYAMLYDKGIIKIAHDTSKVQAYKDFLKDASDSYEPETLAAYLTLKTGKEWTTGSATGYSQGDYVEMIYCKEKYPDGVQNYGEIWLGVCKEFYTIELDENGEEGDTCYGFIVADCQAWKDEDYKRLVCEWEGIKEEDAQLEIIEESHVITQYTYRTV